MSWHDAVNYCAQDGGHLATISSDEEDQSVYGLVTAIADDWWLGASDEMTEGTWEWVTGEAFGYTHWAQDNPDNSPPDPFSALGEDYLAIGSPSAQSGPSQWIDWQYEADGTESLLPFVCEYE